MFQPEIIGRFLGAGPLKKGKLYFNIYNSRCNHVGTEKLLYLVTTIWKRRVPFKSSDQTKAKKETTFSFLN